MVKKICALIGFVFLTQTIYAKGITIKGTFQNAGKSKSFYLYQYYLDGYTVMDSFPQKEGKFTYKSANVLPRGFYRIGETAERSIPFIGGSESFEFQGDLSAPEKTSKFSKSEENAAFKDYMQALGIFSEKINRLYVRMQELNSGNAQLSKEEFQSGMEKVKKQYDSISTSQNTFYLALSKKYPNSLMHKMANILYISDSTNRQNFIRVSEFNDPELLRTDFLTSKISFFFQKYVSPREEDYQKGAEQVLNVAPKGNPSRIAAYMAVGDIFIQSQLPSAEALLNMMRTEYPEDPTVRNYLKKRGIIIVAEGEIAPEISLPDTSGKDLKLSSLRGKVVLIDFWASWCGPCRMENPNVVKAYSRFKDSGFEIYSVSLDNNKYKWQQAIQNDRMTWKHVSDLKGWQSAGAALYSVRSIPATFLLDKDGKIVAKNLRGRALEDTLEKLLK